MGVGRLWGLVGGLLLWVIGLTLVADLGHEAGVAVDSVGDLLQTTVGKLHVVRPLGVVAVTGLLVAEVVTGVVVLHGIVEVVLGGDLIGGLRGVAVGGLGGSSQSGGHQGQDYGSLEYQKNLVYLLLNVICLNTLASQLTYNLFPLLSNLNSNII